jgi:hypothetical protein
MISLGLEFLVLSISMNSLSYKISNILLTVTKIFFTIRYLRFHKLKLRFRELLTVFLKFLAILVVYKPFLFHLILPYGFIEKLNLLVKFYIGAVHNKVKESISIWTTSKFHVVILQNLSKLNRKYFLLKDLHCLRKTSIWFIC